MTRKVLLRIAGLLSIVCLGATYPLSTAFARDVFVLTSFEPYMGRKKNQSRELANWLERHFASSPDLQVYHCPLPTVFDEAPRKALECLDKLPQRPKWFLSLGEGNCSITLETVAFNEDRSQVSDNDGQIRRGEAIFNNAPPRIGFNFPLHEMYCAAKDSGNLSLVSVSTTSQRFLCNHISFHMAYEFMRSETQFAFVHVPHSNCSKSLSIQELGLLFAKMIRRAVVTSQDPKFNVRLLPHQDHYRPMPVTKDQMSFLYDGLKSYLPKDHCYRSFAKKLSAEY